MCVCVSIADLLAGLHGSVCAGELTREQACFDLLVRKFAKKKKVREAELRFGWVVFQLGCKFKSALLVTSLAV